MFNNDWDIILKEEINSFRFKEFMTKMYKLYETKTIFPPKNLIFNALKLTSYENTKVVIIGQDPYFNEGQANGLAFSVNKDIKLPPSLKNIFIEINRDLNIDNNIGDLTNWANQGVLLLNSVLTVEKKSPKSHSNFYWSTFTDLILQKLSEKDDIIYLLWGNDAIKKTNIIENGFILTSSHPSPLAAYRGFNGCGHFSEVNKILKDLNKSEIDWRTF